MFERFSDDARRVVVLAQEDARMLGHPYIGTEHLLLGLARLGAGIVADAFRAFELTHAALRSAVEEIVGVRSPAPAGHIPFTDDARHALEGSLREALDRGDRTIEAWHVLLALTADAECTGARVLDACGIAPTTLRDRVLELRDAGDDDDEPRHAVARGRRAMVATFSTGPQGRPVRRCALCGRDESRSERVLVAGGFRLCSECVGAAQTQLDALPADAPKLVRFRFPEHAPADKDAAVAAIERAFEAVVGPLSVSADDQLPFVEGGDECRALLETLSAPTELPVVVNDVTVERVRFLGDDEAEVSLGTWFAGNPQPMLRPALAVLEDGTWKVSRSTLEEFEHLSRQFRRAPGPR